LEDQRIDKQADSDGLSRRAALRRVGVGGVTVAGMALIGERAHRTGVNAQEIGALSREELQALAEGVVAALNADDPDALDRWVAADVVGHVPLAAPGETADLAWVKEKNALGHTALPDAEISLDGVAIDGTLIAAHGRFRGTHRGDSVDLPATGRSVDVGYVIIVRVDGGKVVEYWYQLDTIGALFQLGLFSLEDVDGEGDGY
jgi:predicted ester cyclase